MGETSVRLLRSWRIPAFALLVLGTHCVVEMFVALGFPRAVPILPSLFLSPLIVAAIASRRHGLFGGAVNFAYLVLSYTVFVFGRGGTLSGDFMTFLVVLFFGVVCGMCAGGLVDRFTRHSTSQGRGQAEGVTRHHCDSERAPLDPIEALRAIGKARSQEITVAPG